MPSVLATLGVPKEQRDLPGRWLASESDVYVRTYRSAARTLTAKVVECGRDPNGYAARDEEELLVEGLRRLQAQGFEEARSRRRMARIAEKFKKVYASLGDLQGQPAHESAEAPAIAAAEALPDEEVTGTPADDELPAHYVIAYTRNRRRACLHRRWGCHMARSLRFLEYELVAEAEPSPERYNSVCGNVGCWREHTRGPLLDFLLKDNSSGPDAEDGTASSSSGEGSTSTGTDDEETMLIDLTR